MLPVVKYIGLRTLHTIDFDAAFVKLGYFSILTFAITSSVIYRHACSFISINADTV